VGSVGADGALFAALRSPPAGESLQEEPPEQVAEREEDEHDQRHRDGGEGDEREI
jgi:hypothetical protein